MKSLMILAAAMTLGGAALAQDTTTTTTTPDTVEQPAADPGMPNPATTAPADQGMQTQTQPMAPTQDPAMQDPAMSQQGTMSQQGAAQPSGMMPAPTTGEYPRCSRTVTDRCIQVPGASSRPRRRR